MVEDPAQPDAVEGDDSIGAVDPSKLPITDAANFKAFYANKTAIQSSIFDVSINFAEIIDGQKVERKCRVVMSPQLAKALTLALINQVKGWERNFGPLPGADQVPFHDTPAPSTEVSSNARQQPPSQSPTAPS